MMKRVMFLAAFIALMAIGTPVVAQEDAGGQGDGEKKAKRERKKKKDDANKEGGERKKRDRQPVKLEEMTLTGKLTKSEKTMKGKDGNERKIERFLLTTADGKKIPMPTPRGAGKKKKKKDGEGENQNQDKKPAKFDLNQFIDKNVTVVAMGMKRTQKRGDKEIVRYAIRKIKSITEAGGIPAGGIEAKDEDE